MANPKYRISAARRDRRRSHLALKVRVGINCENCGSIRQSHRVCDACGFYKGKQVMQPRNMAAADSEFATSAT